jgi:hypothetical protein
MSGIYKVKRNPPDHFVDSVVSEPAMGPYLCELVPGLLRKLQETGAKASGPDGAYVCVSWYLAL